MLFARLQHLVNVVACLCQLFTLHQLGHSLSLLRMGRLGRMGRMGRMGPPSIGPDHSSMITRVNEILTKQFYAPLLATAELRVDSLGATPLELVYESHSTKMAYIPSL